MTGSRRGNPARYQRCAFLMLMSDCELSAILSAHLRCLLYAGEEPTYLLARLASRKSRREYFSAGRILHVICRESGLPRPSRLGRSSNARLPWQDWPAVQPYRNCAVGTGQLQPVLPGSNRGEKGPTKKEVPYRQRLALCSP